MVVFPNCKINIGLDVIEKRADGYHNLETLFYPLAMKDALEVIQSTELTCTLTGLPVTGAVESNLCVKAYRLLKNDFPNLPAVSIHLHKAIPIGAGVGGGSADGAFMLTLLNKKFHLQLTEQQLISYALQLGSDCPFFILNTPCFATGRGEQLLPVALNLSPYKILLINPCIHVSTKEAFSKLIPAKPAKSIQQIIQQPIATWKEELKNDFEDSVFKLHPAIKELKTKLYESGALYASMSGSGSSVFGIFDPAIKIDHSFPEEYTCFTIGANVF